MSVRVVCHMHYNLGSDSWICKLIIIWLKSWYYVNCEYSYMCIPTTTSLNCGNRIVKSVLRYRKKEDTCKPLWQETMYWKSFVTKQRQKQEKWGKYMEIVIQFYKINVRSYRQDVTSQFCRAECYRRKARKSSESCHETTPHCQT